MIILMMTQIVFSQMSMEIYAYSFMAKRTGEINNHINTVKEKKKKETKNIRKKTESKKAKENVTVSYIKPVSGGVST